MSLDKVGEEKDELRRSNSQLKSYLRPWKCLCVHCSHRAETSGGRGWETDKTQNLILGLAKLWCKLNSALQGIYQSKGLDWEKLGSWSCKGNIWEDPDKARDIEPFHSDESSLPVEAASPPQGINPALAEQTVAVFLKAVPTEDNANSP